LCYIFLDVYKDRTGINNRIDEWWGSLSSIWWVCWGGGGGAT
jgi:hypothetical protein